MASLQPVRGTKDMLPDEYRRYRKIVDIAREVAGRYGFQQMSTPIFEFSEVFKRTLGDASDIVNKEMYAFADRGGDELVLRPEGTASIARAFISEGLSQHLPLKLFYEGPMFRYERPQKGRMRQFHQIGIELIGADSSFSDIEIISCAYTLLSELGLKDMIQLDLNTIGDTESRNAYRDKLSEYFKDHQKDLSEDSQRRLQTNPFRILDSKDKGDQALVSNAPLFEEYLNSESRDRFSQVCEGLDDIDIPYNFNPRLVRGLDYYCHVVFEFKSDNLGAQDAVLGGGRYNYLIELMGGPKTPGCGWASGLERLLLLYPNEVPAVRPISLVPLGARAEKAIIGLSHNLRKAGIATDVSYGGNLSKRMKKAHKVNAKAAVILGDDELDAGEATVKDLDSGAQLKMKLDQLVQGLQNFPNKDA